MNNPSHTDENEKKIHALLKNYDNGMLVSRGEDGRLRARPMAIAKLEEDDTLYFITALDSSKVGEMQRDDNVCIAFERKGEAVSISGSAHVVDDRAQIKALWSKGFELWFPDGPDDPNVVALVVHPDEGEYWNDRGWNKIKFAVRAVKAFATGERVEHDREEHARVKLT
jgi:general stress protein 26